MRTTPRASLHRIRLFLRSQFLDHPRSLRESYWEHHRNALHFSAAADKCRCGLRSSRANSVAMFHRRE